MLPPWPDRHRERAPQRARQLDRSPATVRAGRRLAHPRGRDDYRMRARSVEPMIGQLKTCQNLTMMSHRGFTACQNANRWKWQERLGRPVLACPAGPVS
jgi:hypothetical protein